MWTRERRVNVSKPLRRAVNAIAAVAVSALLLGVLAGLPRASRSRVNE
jgi:hypothetical protein